jgi:rod shape-determining protein MreD
VKTYSIPWLLAIAAAALAVELTLLSNVAWAGARPDLLIPVVIFAALFAAEPSHVLGTAWVAGLMRDLGTAGPLGQYALIYLVIAWILSGARTYLFREHPLTQAAVGAGGAAVAGLASAACTAAFVGGIPLGLCFARTSVSALATALVAPVAVTILSRSRFLVR